MKTQELGINPNEKNPSMGDIWCDLATDKFYVYMGGDWQEITINGDMHSTAEHILEGDISTSPTTETDYDRAMKGI